MKHNTRNLVLSGGGIKGIATLGALKRVYEYGFDTKELDTITGVSVGAVIATLLSIGYTPTELIDAVILKDTKTLYDISLVSLVKRYGLESGKHILEWIIELFERKRVSSKITLAQHKTEYKVTLRIVATNLNLKKSIVFDYSTHPDLSVIDAMRMSISVPFAFSCVRYDGCIYVDGCVTDNYPIELYKGVEDTTLGIQTVSRDSETNIENFSDFIKAVLKCVNSQLNDKPDKCTIRVECDSVGSVDLNIPLSEKKRLVKIGYDSACEYFETEYLTKDTKAI